MFSGSSAGESSSAPASSAIAPQRHLPRTTFTAVEYPGPVSHPSALLTVISQDDLNQCFNAPAGATGVQIEMSYRKGDRACVPVRGVRVPSSKLLLKIKRRRRRVADSEEERETEGSQSSRLRRGKEVDQGVFVSEIVGSVVQTVRFRQMADYHYTPNPEGRVSTIVSALEHLDYDAILDYTVPQLDEDFIEPVEPPLGEELPADFIPFRSRSDLQPPPLFTQRFVAPTYGYKNHPQTVLETVVDPYTGETRQRFVNKARNYVSGPQRIGHGHAQGDVPREPVKPIRDKLAKLKQPLLEKLRDIFQKRPVWLRHGLLAQLTPEEERIIVNDKSYLAATSYILGAGPYWKCYIRLGYDPVYDPAAFIYQRIYFYVAVSRSKTTMLRAQSVESVEQEDEEEEKGADWWAAEQERRIAAGERGPIDRTKAHLFDGLEIHRGKPDFQFCDITDPLIRKYIEDPNLRTDTCDSKDGWFKPVAMTAIRNISKIKYVYVREHGRPAPNELCYDEIEKLERGLRVPAEGKDGEKPDQDEDEDEDEDMR